MVSNFFNTTEVDNNTRTGRRPSRMASRRGVWVYTVGDGAAHWHFVSRVRSTEI